MSAGDYTVTLSIDAWSVTLDRGEQTDPAADAVTMDPLTASWSMTNGYPSQPTPVAVSFGLFIPNVSAGPVVNQGSRVSITITTPDHALPGVAPVLEFDGTVTDVDATPLADGLAFSIVAAEYRAELADLRVGDQPWPAEGRHDRLLRVLLWAQDTGAGRRIGYPYVDSFNTNEEVQFELAGLGPDVAARDVDSRPVSELLEELFDGAALWMGVSPAFYVTGYVDGTFQSPTLGTWARPIVGQSISGTQVTYPICLVPAGLPDVDAAFPYQLDLVGGVATLVRKSITPDTSLVAWVSAEAIESETVKWRQDKAGNVNRVRAVASDLVTIGLAHTGSIVAEYPELIAAYGPNEVTVTLDPQTDYVATTDLIYARLGTRYDAAPRWTFDEITIRTEQIPSGDQWPRLFSPREHAHIWDQAAGRLVFITDMRPEWNLHDRSDYFGRLAGATLTLSGGRIKLTAQLAHRLPIGGGVESATQVPPLEVDPAPTHHPITCAELAAGANPNVNQCGDLTPADMQLVEG